MQTLIFNSRNEFLRLTADNIVCIEADGNVTHIYTANELRSTIAINIGKMEEALATQLGKNASTFVRLGRHYIVNHNYVYRINIMRQELILSDGKHFARKVEVSKEALRRFRDILLRSSVKPE